MPAGGLPRDRCNRDRHPRGAVAKGFATPRAAHRVHAIRGTAVAVRDRMSTKQFAPSVSNDVSSLSLDELATIHGGDANEAINGLKRAQELKGRGGSLDLFGYVETERQGVGLEVRQRLSPNVSVFGRGTTGMKNNKPDSGISGGIRFEW